MTDVEALGQRVDIDHWMDATVFMRISCCLKDYILNLTTENGLQYLGCQVRSLQAKRMKCKTFFYMPMDDDGVCIEQSVNCKW